MQMDYLDDIVPIREAFIRRFVLSWETFQQKRQDWIDEMHKIRHSVDEQWYERAYLWEKMDVQFRDIPMKQALAILREHSDTVVLMAEKVIGENRHIEFIARTDAHQLADRIEYEWFESYRLFEQNKSLSDELLPGDLYVFDMEMEWCIVFTHETLDWEAELNGDMMKVAESRWCMICNSACLKQ